MYLSDAKSVSWKTVQLELQVARSRAHFMTQSLSVEHVDSKV